MVDLLHAINFLEIQNSKDADRAARKLDDLKDEAQEMQQRGIPVKSWHDFKRDVEIKKPNYTKNISIGAAIGAAALGGISMIAFAPLVPYGLISGGILGGLLGGYHQTENSQHLKKVATYEQYVSHIKGELGTNVAKGQAPEATAAPEQEVTHASGGIPGTIVAPILIAKGVDSMFQDQNKSSGTVWG